MVYVREDTYVSNVLPLTLQSRQPLHRTLHRVRVVPARSVRRLQCEGGFCVREKMPLVDIRSAAEADLALEENVDTLSLPYGPRLHSPVHPRDARLISSSRKGPLVTPSPRPLSKASPYSRCRCFVRPPSECNPVPSGRPAGRSAVVALLAVSPTMVDPRSPPQRKKHLVDAAS